WIVTRGGKGVTRPADNGILRGITRTVLIDVIRARGLEFEERPFTVEEAYGAREAFLTSASQIVMPVGRIDDRPVGNGGAGAVGTRAAGRVPPPRRVDLKGPSLPYRGTLCPQLVLAPPAGVACNGGVRVLFECARLEHGHSDLAISLAGKGPASEKMEQRQWRLTAHKISKTPSLITSARIRPRSRSSW